MSGRIITVDFHDDVLFAFERDDGVFVAIKPICDAMGLVWRAQWKRLQEDSIFAEGITVTVMPSAGGTQETTLLKLQLVHGWLLTIEDKRIADPIVREKVLRYKRECYEVLFRHFSGQAGRTKPQVIDHAPDADEAEAPKIRLVTECRQTFGHAAAAQLWFKLGLPVVPAMFHDPRQLNLLA